MIGIGLKRWRFCGSMCERDFSEPSSAQRLGVAQAPVSFSSLAASVRRRLLTVSFIFSEL